MAQHRCGDRGQAVVELAFTVPVLLAVLVLGLWAASVARTAIVLADQARDAARAIARGGVPPTLDPGIAVTRIDEGSLVTIRLTTTVQAPVLGLGLTLDESASSLKEVGS